MTNNIIDILDDFKFKKSNLEKLYYVCCMNGGYESYDPIIHIISKKLLSIKKIDLDLIYYYKYEVDIDDKITFLKSKVGTWPPDCSGGQYWSGSSCVCPLGQVFENGICEIQTQDYEINWWLVGGLGLLIAVLIIYRLKDKLFGVKQNDEDKELSDDNSFYSAFE